MIREEEGIINNNAGIDLIEELCKKNNEKFPILCLCQDVAKSQINAAERDIKGKFKFVDSVGDLNEFLSLKGKFFFRKYFFNRIHIILTAQEKWKNLNR